MFLKTTSDTTSRIRSASRTRHSRYSAVYRARFQSTVSAANIGSDRNRYEQSRCRFAHFRGPLDLRILRISSLKVSRKKCRASVRGERQRAPSEAAKNSFLALALVHRCARRKRPMSTSLDRNSSSFDAQGRLNRGVCAIRGKGLVQAFPTRRLGNRDCPASAKAPCSMILRRKRLRSNGEARLAKCCGSAAKQSRLPPSANAG